MTVADEDDYSMLVNGLSRAMSELASIMMMAEVSLLVWSWSSLKRLRLKIGEISRWILVKNLNLNFAQDIWAMFCPCFAQDLKLMFGRASEAETELVIWLEIIYIGAFGNIWTMCWNFFPLRPLSVIGVAIRLKGRGGLDPWQGVCLTSGGGSGVAWIEGAVRYQHSQINRARVCLNLLCAAPYGVWFLFLYMSYAFKMFNQSLHGSSMRTRLRRGDTFL